MKWDKQGLKVPYLDTFHGSLVYHTRFKLWERILKRFPLGAERLP